MHQLTTPSSDTLRNVFVTVHLYNMTSDTILNLTSEEQYMYLPDPIIIHTNRRATIQR